MGYKQSIWGYCHVDCAIESVVYTLKVTKVSRFQTRRHVRRAKPAQRPRPGPRAWWTRHQSSPTLCANTFSPRCRFVRVEHCRVACSQHRPPRWRSPLVFQLKVGNRFELDFLLSHYWGLALVLVSYFAVPKLSLISCEFLAQGSKHSPRPETGAVIPLQSTSYVSSPALTLSFGQLRNTVWRIEHKVFQMAR